MPQTYIWVHEDALSLNHPVFKSAGDTARAVFIWDEAYFKQQAYSLKRLTFIYECLIDLQEDVEVYHGDTETVVRSLFAEGGPDGTLYVADTPNPVFLNIAAKLESYVSVKIVENTPFIEAPDDVDMTRFFRFWNRSRKSAFGFKPSA